MSDRVNLHINLTAHERLFNKLNGQHFCTITLVSKFVCMLLCSSCLLCQKWTSFLCMLLCSSSLLCQKWTSLCVCCCVHQACCARSEQVCVYVAVFIKLAVPEVNKFVCMLLCSSSLLYQKWTRLRGRKTIKSVSQWPSRHFVSMDSSPLVSAVVLNQLFFLNPYDGIRTQLPCLQCALSLQASWTTKRKTKLLFCTRADVRTC